MSGKMRNVKLFMMLITLLPWVSVPLLPAKVFNRFLPAVIFISFYVTAEGYLAEKKRWWWFPISVKPNVIGELPLIFGPFFVGSLWILKYTFGKFKLYMLINLVVDAFFTYFTIDWLKKIGYVTLVRLTKFQLSLLFLVKSFVMYGFQVVYEKYIYRDPAK